MEKILIAGGEGTGGNALACIEDMRRDYGSKFQVEGFLNDFLFSAENQRKIRGLPVVGKLDDSLKFFKDGYRFVFAVHPIGHGKTRKEAFEKMNIPVEGLVSVIHPRTFIAFDAKVEPGVILLPGCSIFSGSRIGQCSFVGNNVSIGHDSEIESFCHLSNGAVISSYVRVGQGTDICLNSTILDMVKVADFSVIGSCSLLTRDATESGVYLGNPARMVKRISDIPDYELNPSERSKLET